MWGILADGLASAMSDSGGGAASTPMQQTYTGGAINVGVANPEPLLAGGSPYTGGMGMDLLNRFGFTSGGSPVYSAQTGAPVMSTMNWVILGAVGLGALIFMKKR